MNQAPAKLPGVALAISAFRSDVAVLTLLEAAFASGMSPFAAVIVVDSLGSGAIEQTARARGWDLHYINADHNLGSAGNLDLRLRTAADLGMSWCFALNHDGVVDVAKVEALLRQGGSRPRVGAVYPQLIFSAAKGRADSPRGGFGTYGFLRDRGDDRSGCSEVAWSSSNGALYNLDAVRDGARVWPDLWMGYEDLAFGWELQRRGWVQLLCSNVPLIDTYEFAEVGLLGRRMHLAAKPSWYMYYQLRNLALIARRSRGQAVGWGSVALRTLVDVSLILLFRDRKLERLKLLLSGLVAGLRNRAGKGPVP